MNDIIFPTDCSKSNIKYLLDIGCRVAVKIKYSMTPTGTIFTNDIELRYGDFCSQKYNLEFCKADWSEVMLNDMLGVVLFINRDDLI